MNRAQYGEVKPDIALCREEGNEGGYGIQCHPLPVSLLLGNSVLFLPSVKGCSVFRDCYIPLTLGQID